MHFLLGDEFTWIATFPPLAQWVIAIAIGASAVGIPLYAKVRKLVQDAKLESIEVHSREADVVAKEELNTAAEFQRIIKYRDDEIKRLTDRDEAQEKKIQELYDRHLECARNEARQDERSKMNAEKIITLERKVMLLEMVIHEKAQLPNVTINTAGTPAVVKAEDCPPNPTTISVETTKLIVPGT